MTATCWELGLVCAFPASPSWLPWWPTKHLRSGKLQQSLNGLLCRWPPPLCTCLWLGPLPCSKCTPSLSARARTRNYCTRTTSTPAPQALVDLGWETVVVSLPCVLHSLPLLHNLVFFSFSAHVDKGRGYSL